jgi:hypothetical protein
MSKKRNRRLRHVPLVPTQALPHPKTADAPSTLTPDGWVKRANKFSVKGDRDGFTVSYKGLPVAYMSVAEVYAMGLTEMRRQLIEQHGKGTRVTMSKDGEITVSVRTGEQTSTYSYRGTLLDFLVAGLGRLPKKFALNDNLSNDRDAVKLALRRHLNYLTYQLNKNEEERRRANEEARQRRELDKMPA